MVTQLNGRQVWCRLLLGARSGAPRSKRHQAWRQPSGARHKALYLNLVYRERLPYDIGWARLDAFCLVPLYLRSAWRRRVAPNLNQKVENATLKNYSACDNHAELSIIWKYTDGCPCLCYIHEPWLSIREFLNEWIFQHGFYMDARDTSSRVWADLNCRCFVLSSQSSTRAFALLQITAFTILTICVRYVGGTVLIVFLGLV